MSAEKAWGKVQEMMTKRPATVDLLLTLAGSALGSYRAGTVARPLPKGWETEEARKILEDELEPPCMWTESNNNKLEGKRLELVDYLLHPDCVSIRKVGVATWLQSLEKRLTTKKPRTPLGKVMLPDFVFELDHGRLREEYPNALARAKHAEFVRAAETHPVIIAYHGTELCNVYNILRESLKNDKNLSGRNGQVFGKGIYLSEEPMVAVNFLHYGRAWKHCAMGHSIACLLECEVVCDPVAVMRGEKEKDARVPEKYVLVQNDCLVRVKRILVYAEKPPAPSSDYRWVGKWLLVLFVVALFLLAARKSVMSFVSSSSNSLTAHYWAK